MEGTVATADLPPDGRSRHWFSGALPISTMVPNSLGRCSERSFFWRRRIGGVVASHSPPLAPHLHTEPTTPGSSCTACWSLGNPAYLRQGVRVDGHAPSHSGQRLGWLSKSRHTFSKQAGAFLYAELEVSHSSYYAGPLCCVCLHYLCSVSCGEADVL